jgi:toxin ParE1/3/4
MACQIRIEAHAEVELEEAVAWYETLGITFLKRFYEAVSKLREKPEMYEIVYKTFRKAHLKQFPFAVFYAIEKKSRQIVILSVWHTSQDTQRLKHKLK